MLNLNLFFNIKLSDFLLLGNMNFKKYTQLYITFSIFFEK